MDKIYKIDNKEYKLKQTTLKDWKKISEVLKGLSNNPLTGSGANMSLNLLLVVDDLISNGIAVKLLELIITPLNTSADLELIEDAVLVEVTGDFFISKKSLIENILSYSANLQQQKPKLEKK